MHFPVLICGFACGPLYGCGVGFIAPLLRSLTLGMPALFPNAIGMAVELASYGAISGIMHKYLPRKPIFIYVSLVTAMLVGRIIWGAARYFLMVFSTKATFTLALFWTNGFVNAMPGIICQIILVPAIVLMLDKSGFGTVKPTEQ